MLSRDPPPPSAPSRPSLVTPWSSLRTPQPLTAREREALAHCRFDGRSVLAGQEEIGQSSAADRLYFLEQGWACQFKSTRDGRRQISRVLIAGDFLNIEGLILGRHDYGVLLLTDGRVSSTSVEPVRKVLGEQGGIASRFAWLAARENAIGREALLRVARLNANERLAHLLCEVAVRLGFREAEGTVSFELPLIQDVLADMLGLTVVHINRTLQWMRADGLLKTSGKVVTIQDVGALRHLCEFDPAYLLLDAIV